MTILLAAHAPCGYGAGMEQALPDSGWRGSAELWLDAAYQALIESGVDAVKIQLLAKGLNLSRTSFYWFFKDREELLQALVARWRDKNTGSIVRQAEAYAESIAEAMLNVFDCWHNPELFDSQFEFAVRSWALQSPEVLAEVRSKVRVTPVYPDDRFLNGFQHIFGGGYAAGYYSYKWAEVIAADVFEAFKESGDVCSPEVGQRFFSMVLAQGAARPFMESFVAFRGRTPSEDALLRLTGLL